VSREFIKQIDWQLGYDTSDRAKKVGLLISKKWIDAGKPNLRAFNEAKIFKKQTRVASQEPCKRNSLSLRIVLALHHALILSHGG